MVESKTICILRQMQERIRFLESRNRILEEKCKVIDAFSMALNHEPRTLIDKSDIIWDAEQIIEELQSKNSVPLKEPVSLNEVE